MVGASQTMAVVMPVSVTICGDRAARIHQGGELAEHLATAHLHGTDLGDRVESPAILVALGPTAGGLEVDDDEGRLAQWQVGQSGEQPSRIVAEDRVDVAEAQLAHGRTVGVATDTRLTSL